MYFPSPPPSDEDFKRYLADELEKIRQEFREIYPHSVTLDQINVLPDKPRDGQIYYADGTNWNPGSGEGVYAYYNATWNKL